VQVSVIICLFTKIVGCVCQVTEVSHAVHEHMAAGAACRIAIPRQTISR